MMESDKLVDCQRLAYACLLKIEKATQEKDFVWNVGDDCFYAVRNSIPVSHTLEVFQKIDDMYYYLIDYAERFVWNNCELFDAREAEFNEALTRTYQ